MRGDAVSVGVYVCNKYVHDSVQECGVCKCVVCASVWCVHACGECMMGLCMTVVSTGVGMCSV